MVWRAGETTPGKVDDERCIDGDGQEGTRGVADESGSEQELRDKDIASICCILHGMHEDSDKQAALGVIEDLGHDEPEQGDLRAQDERHGHNKRDGP